MSKCFRKSSEYLNRAEEKSGQHAGLNNNSGLSIMCNNLIHPTVSTAPNLNVSSPGMNISSNWLPEHK